MQKARVLYWARARIGRAVRIVGVIEWLLAPTAKRARSQFRF
jgi:hypothetical protein